MQDLHLRIIGKVHAFELHASVKPGGGSHHPGAVLHVGFGIQHFKDAFTRRQGMLEHVVDGMNLVHRNVEQRQIRHEHHELSHFQVPLRDVHRPHPQNEDRAHGPEKNHRR